MEEVVVNQQPFNMRLAGVTLCFVGLILYPMITEYIYKDTPDDTEYTIPTHGDIKEAFDNIKDMKKYKPDTFDDIYSDLIKIIRVGATKDISQEELVTLQIRLRKNIDKMELYLPYDSDIRGRWEVNIKIIIRKVLRIIKEAL